MRDPSLAEAVAHCAERARVDDLARAVDVHELHLLRERVIAVCEATGVVMPPVSECVALEARAVFSPAPVQFAPQCLSADTIATLRA